MSDKYNKEEESIIQKIQNQTGCLLLVIGIAMLAFVLTDLLSSGSSIFGSSANSVGKIAGDNVSYEEYNSVYERILANVTRNNPGIELDERFRESYKQEAWNYLVQLKLINKQHELLGLTVSGDELEDLTIGDNTHDELKQAFSNPDTKEFDKQRLVQYLTEDIEVNPDAKKQWLQYEKELVDQIIEEKYNALVSKIFYGTELEARTRLVEQQQSINANFVSITFESYEDSSLTVSDNEIIDYVRDHEYKFKQEESRDIEFVIFDVKPSREDTLSTIQWASDNIEKFEKATDDSLFVALMNSETPFDPEFKIRGSFAKEVEEELFKADTGAVLGPYELSGIYSLFKVVEIGTDSLPAIKVGHITIRIQGRTNADTAKAMEEARQLIADIKRGKTTFEEEAKVRNYDASKNSGGDLGWLRKSTYDISQEFLDKALSTPKDEYFVFKSSKGVEIGRVASERSSRMIKVAQLSQRVIPSTNTDKEYYRKAGEFVSQLGSDENFEEVAEKLGLTKRVSNKITEESRRVAGITNGNIVARWLFDANTEEGDVSDIIEVDNKYVVARVTKIREEGLPDADDVRGEVEPLVLNEKKAKQIVPKFEEALNKEPNADELASALNTIVAPVPAASFENANLPYVGQDNKVTGAIFGVEPGKRSGIVVGNTGVYVIYVNNLNEFTMPSDLKSKQMEIRLNLSQGFEANIEQALIKIGDVKDMRYKFYN